MSETIEYGKIDIGKIKHPEGRYIIHRIDSNLYINLPCTQPIANHLSFLSKPTTIIVDNYGEYYYFSTNQHHSMGPLYSIDSPNIKFLGGSALFMNQFPPGFINMVNIELTPLNKSNKKLSNNLINFVKSQKFPIENINMLSKQELNDNLQLKLDTQIKINKELQSKLEEYIQINKDLNMKLINVVKKKLN